MKVALIQTWKTLKLPSHLQKLYDEWDKIHPDFHHILLDDDGLRQHVKDITPEYLNFYDNMTRNIERVDFARYVILYGGMLNGQKYDYIVYSDLDVQPLKKLDKWIQTNKVVLGREPLEHARQIYNRDVVLCNAVMLSPPKKEVWKKFMDYIVKNYSMIGNVVYNTGPMAMTQFYEQHKSDFNDVIITDPCIFFPLTAERYSSKQQNGFKSVSETCDMNEAYTAHLWNNSYVTDKIQMGMIVFGFIFILLIIIASWYGYM